MVGRFETTEKVPFIEDCCRNYAGLRHYISEKSGLFSGFGRFFRVLLCTNEPPSCEPRQAIPMMQIVQIVLLSRYITAKLQEIFMIPMG